MTDTTHAFVVPAYGYSPHLRDCLASLAGQTCSSPIVVCTSTPFHGMDTLCAQFGARVVRHGPNGGIGRDWNAALSAADGELVTIAHQDDIYLPEFSAELMSANERRPRSALYFCSADEITQDGRPRVADRNNSIKRVMVAVSYAGRDTVADPLSRRLLLGFGNPIVCPTVTINRRVAPHFRFREELRTNMDWLAWLDLSREGAVTRINKRLVSHRVHSDSETARCLDDGTRRREDELVFGQLWPSPLAKALVRLYSHSYGGYV